MFCEHIFLQSSKGFINREIYIVCWLQCYPLAALYEWKLFKSAIFVAGFFTLKNAENSVYYRPKLIIFVPVKLPFFKPQCSMNQIKQVCDVRTWREMM